MKPQTLGLVVAACMVGLAVNVGIALMLVRGGLLLEQGLPPLAQNDVLAEVFTPDGDAVFPNQVHPGPAGAPCTKADLQAVRGPVVPADAYTFSGPFTHANLSVVLIHGPDTLKDQKVATLQEALEQNLVVVHEGRLTIDNRGDVPVFIQAGDIVKGGIQDRVLPYDQIIPPHSGGIALAGFCVEAGRSGPRGLELSTSFQSATEQLPGKQLNLAARYRQSQAEVWAGVRRAQQALTQNLGGPVQSPRSQTSLQLTLENPRVHQAVAGYLNELTPLLAGKKDVIGVAVAVNGQVQGAEAYASAALLQRLWPKLLKASAVAALAERRPGAITALPAATFQKVLTGAEEGQAFRQETPGRGLVFRQEAGQILLFDTCDPARQNLVLHRSYLVR